MAADTNLTIGHNLLPKTSGNINLGDSTHKWVIDASQLSGSVDASQLSGSVDASVLPNSGATAGSYGDSGSTRTVSNGDTFSIPYVTVDAKGRVTSASTKTMTLNAAGSNAVVLSSTEPTNDDCVI